MMIVGGGGGGGGGSGGGGGGGSGGGSGGGGGGGGGGEGGEGGSNTGYIIITWCNNEMRVVVGATIAITKPAMLLLTTVATNLFACISSENFCLENKNARKRIGR
ncbi:unnamed protein product [Litomosoides sigmodontis]|uniref:Uncharacterized protein n=1 Tax=Litomosoides sigmodontis TaxID=42156 RepID=A0A3P6UDH1_LITSI|nr:unnamed protein product [Litomosoides sigmodontis]